ncbi:MAG: transposase [Anaerolineaceae bacterium]|nr:MAG: transposase [Anaerolineaceae bacterium]
MNDGELLDIYTNYLIGSFGLTTQTGLSRLLNGAISHDRVQRFLSREPRTGKDLWLTVKPYVRQIQRADGVIIVDDSISEKPYTDENAIIAWHYDHTKGRSIKGINFITAMYHVQDVSLPVGYQLVEKTEFYIDKKTGKEKRRSSLTKNERYQQLLWQALQNKIAFRYVLNDVWFASAKNMMFVKHELERDFIMPLKTNRKVALSLEDKKQGRYVRVDTMELEPDAPSTIYLEGVDFPLNLVKQVFTNGDGSMGILYLVTNALELTADEITTIYGKRWNVESYHKSLKQNASLSKSPTKTVTTQSNHIFASMCAFIKLELLKVSTQTNHFALKSKLYIRALRTAFDTLNELQPVRLAA